MSNGISLAAGRAGWKIEMLRGVRVATDDVTLGRSADRARGLLLPPGVARGRGRWIASLHLPLTLADLQKKTLTLIANASHRHHRRRVARANRMTWEIEFCVGRELESAQPPPHCLCSQLRLRLFSLIGCNSIAIAWRISIWFYWRMVKCFSDILPADWEILIASDAGKSVKT